MPKMEILNELALCAGIGGISLGFKRARLARTVCHVEWDQFCARVLQSRMADGRLDDAPIWDDVRTFDGKPWRGRVDVLSAGFPCQPFSQAGEQRGTADERHLWPDVIRIIREVGPGVVVLENVAGLASNDDGRTMGTVLGQLAEYVQDQGGGGHHLRSRVR